MKKLTIVFIASLLVSLFVSGLCLADPTARWVSSPEGLLLRDTPSLSYASRDRINDIQPTNAFMN